MCVGLKVSSIQIKRHCISKTNIQKNHIILDFFKDSLFFIPIFLILTASHIPGQKLSSCSVLSFIKTKDSQAVHKLINLFLKNSQSSLTERKGTLEAII